MSPLDPARVSSAHAAMMMLYTVLPTVLQRLGALTDDEFERVIEKERMLATMTPEGGPANRVAVWNLETIQRFRAWGVVLDDSEKAARARASRNG